MASRSRLVLFQTCQVADIAMEAPVLLAVDSVAESVKFFPLSLLWVIVGRGGPKAGWGQHKRDLGRGGMMIAARPT